MLSDAAARTGGGPSNRNSGMVSRTADWRVGNRPASVQHVDAERKEQSGKRVGSIAAVLAAAAHPDTAINPTAIGNSRHSRVMIAPHRLAPDGSDATRGFSARPATPTR